MAGGGKETPRQKMIGMMYLVLTALLALQVSNSVLDKFMFIDESLKHSIQVTMDSNNKIVEGIKATVEKNGSRPRDVEVVKKAETVKQLTADLLNEFVEFRRGIENAVGGYSEDGKILDMAGYDKQMFFTLGPEGSKKGAAYALGDKMNEYIEKLNAMHDSLNMPPLALDAKDIDQFKNDPDQRTKDFAQLNFQNTPTAACMAIVSQLKSEVVQAEAKALETLAKDVGADQIKFDKIVAVVKPYSQVVAAGTKYQAEMFIAASSSSSKPKMTYNGQEIKVEEGKGLIEFVATPGTYDADGNAEKSWKGEITIATPFGDTTFVVDEKYVVAKPTISIQAAAVSALYFNCGNELNVQVPALGSTYDPSFSAEGGEVIKGAKKGLVTIVPSQAKVKLNVYSSGNMLGSETFRVKPVPKPEIKLFSGNRPVDLKNGVAAPGPRTLEVKPIPDADFAEFLPNDARFRVVEWEVTLARGRRGVATKKVTDQTVNLSDFASQARAGDRIVIEVKKVLRMNFKNRTEEVRGVDDIITIPIQ